MRALVRVQRQVPVYRPCLVLIERFLKVFLIDQSDQLEIIQENEVLLLLTELTELPRHLFHLRSWILPARLRKF